MKQFFEDFDFEDRGGKAFVRDLGRLLDLKPPELDRVLDALPGIHATLTRSEEQKAAKDLAVGLDLKEEVIVSSCGVLTCFFKLLAEEESVPEKMAGSVVAQLPENVIPAGKKDDFVKVLEKVISRLPIHRKIVNRLRHEGGVLPTLSSADATVEMRGIVEKDFVFGEDLSRYAPRIVGSVPIISVAIRVNAGHVRELGFQMSEKELEYMIDILSAAKKDKDALKEHMKPQRKDG